MLELLEYCAVSPYWKKTNKQKKQLAAPGLAFFGLNNQQLSSELKGIMYGGFVTQNVVLKTKIVL